MKLVAKNTITDGMKTYNKGDVFEVSKNFPETLVNSGAADYLEPVKEEDEEIVVEVPGDLTELSVEELKELCKKLEIKSYSNKNKEDLIEMIEADLADDAS